MRHETGSGKGGGGRNRIAFEKEEERGRAQTTPVELTEERKGIPKTHKNQAFPAFVMVVPNIRMTNFQQNIMADDKRAKQNRKKTYDNHVLASPQRRQ